jgi:3-(3-hydroxy-phenyl)propionate hydroxylase
MTNHAVVIAGAGPTGLMLSAELTLAGVDVVVIERRTTQEFAGSRAGGLHVRTLEVLDQRGVAERFIAQGQKYPALSFASTRLDLSDFPTRHNHLLALWQLHSERILAEWVGELGVNVQRGIEVTGLTQDDVSVDVALSDGRSLHAEYLVGCDGGRSLVRKTAGIEFAGWDASKSWLMADAEWTEEPPWGFRHDALGSHAIAKLDGPKQMGVVLTEPRPDRDTEPTLEDVRELLVTVYGTDYGIHSPTKITRFNDTTRQAAAYRKGRILLAGDAAHVHPPMGGQGLNIGVQDAVNLGWKLAQVVQRISPDSLLDTYHAERHPIAARVLKNTMAQVALTRQDDRTKALGEMVSEFLQMDEPRKRLAAEMSGLGVRYDLGEGHPLLGRRMPDLDLVTADGPRRVYTLLHEARPVLLNLGEPGSVRVGPWADRVRSVDVTLSGAWELPVIGVVTAPAAVLIRPDGYVAWVGEGTDLGLEDALGRWFGKRIPELPGPLRTDAFDG